MALTELDFFLGPVLQELCRNLNAVRCEDQWIEGERKKGWEE